MMRRRTHAWIACLAMLVHMLAMPLASGLSAETRQRLGWGGFCPLTQQLSHAQHAADSDAQSHEQNRAGHASMPFCCCAGFAGLIALPVSSSPLADPSHATLAALPPEPLIRLSPRRNWPALNPRASPAA